jgi:hypothetical protein
MFIILLVPSCGSLVLPFVQKGNYCIGRLKKKKRAISRAVMLHAAPLPKKPRSIFAQHESQIHHIHLKYDSVITPITTTTTTTTTL